jgi:TRAP transporter 4TM/12TM fusion protein
MRQLQGATGFAVAAWSAGFAAMHMWYAWEGYPEPLRMRTFHLFGFLSVLFLLYPAFKRFSPQHRPSLIDWAWALACLLPSAYIYAYASYVQQRSDWIDPLAWYEVALALIAILGVAEAVRRAVTPLLAGLMLAAVAYMAIYWWMGGRAAPFLNAIETVYISTNGNGIYGFLTGISSNTVAIFIIFGAFVNFSGANRFLGNLGTVIAGRYAGGPAKVEVISSAMFGTMSGSSVSNVVTTGSITIPLMKSRGYPGAVAGGIEAASSVGGALMPPVMGTAAFVMAEIVNVPYSDVAIAAILGSVLYYLAIVVTVDLEARKMGLRGLPASEIPGWRKVARDAHLMIPVVLLIWQLMEDRSPNRAAFVAIMAMIAVVVLREVLAVLLRLPGEVDYAPSDGLGARCAKAFAAGLRNLFAALADGGYTAAYVAVAVAAASVIAAALTNTGVITSFGGAIKAASGGSLAVLGLLLMAMCLILGMGVPTTPAYIITAAIGAPLLTSPEFAVPALGAHLFIFYFAVLADATPPVAVASYAAAAIAQAPPLLTGLHAFRLAFGGFVVGYAFLYNPAIMLRGTVTDIVATLALYAIALTLISAGLVGWLRSYLHLWARCVLVVAGLLIAFAKTWPVEQRLLAGLVAFGVFLFAPRAFGVIRAVPRPVTAHG